MDEFRKMAGRYFEVCEGRSLYPSLRKWHWYAFFGAFALLLAVLVWALKAKDAHLQDLRMLPVLAIECVVAGVWLTIERFKIQTFLGGAKPDSDTARTLDQARCRALEDVCGSPADTFASIAKECSDLLDLEAAYGPAVGGFATYKRMIYDPESKSRLLSIGLFLLSVVLALTNRSLPDGPSAIDILMSDGFWELAKAVALMLTILFGILVAFHAFFSAIFRKITVWWTRLSGNSEKSRTAMNMFMADLIRLHRPMSRQAT